MKTYEEYLKIIKDREHKAWVERHKDHEHYTTGKNDPILCIDGSDIGKMTFDYSVEIMGMMMQDFLKELKTYPIQFDSKGRIKVVVDTLDTTSKGVDS